MVLAKQYLQEQIKKATGLLEDVFMQTEVNETPKHWVSDCKMEVTPGKTQVDGEKEGIRAVHTLYNRIHGHILEIKGAIPLPLSRLAWSSLCVTKNQIISPILMWQTDLALAV